MSRLLLAVVAATLAAAPAAHAAGPGAIDSTFGQGGQATGVIGGGGTTLTGMAEQADGSILTAGHFQVVNRGAMFPGQMFAALARFSPEGDLEPEFGTEGWTLDDRYDVTGPPALQRDGKIVVPGGRLGPGDGTAKAHVARYDADGSRDRGFGDDGIVRLDLPFVFAFVSDVQVDREGNLVLSVFGQEEPFSGGSRFGVARLTPAGELDPTFGDEGVAIVDRSAGDQNAGPLALLPDGGVVVAGGSRSQEPAVLASFDSRGRPDPRWGGDGILSTGFAGNAGDLALEGDDRVVLVATEGTPPYPRRAAVVRYDLSGERDRAFGVNGGFAATIGSSTDAEASVRQGDGKRVIAGGFYKARNVSTQPGPDGSVPDEFERPGTNGWGLIRIRADGKLDRGFGNDGRVTSPLGPNFSSATSVLQQEDGRLVAGGTSTTCRGATITLVRYHGDDTGVGLPDPGPIVKTCPGDAPVDTGGIELTIACPLVEMACEGDIVLDVPASQYTEAPAATGSRARRPVKIAASRYRTAGNRRHVATVKLSRAGKLMVRRGKRFRAGVTIVSRDSRGKRRTTRSRVLVAPRR